VGGFAAARGPGGAAVRHELERFPLGRPEDMRSAGLFLRGRKEAMAFEMLTRRTLRLDCDALPTFLPVWQEDVGRAAIYIGGRGSEQVRLLSEFTLSHLTGMHSGDHSN